MSSRLAPSGGGRNRRQGSGLPAASTGTLGTGCSAALRVRVRFLTQAAEQWWASSRPMKTWVNMQNAVRKLGTRSSISSCTWKRPKLPMSAGTWAKGATVTGYRLLSWGHQTALQLALGHGLLGAVAVLRYCLKQPCLAPPVTPQLPNSGLGMTEYDEKIVHSDLEDPRMFYGLCDRHHKRNFSGLAHSSEL